MIKKQNSNVSRLARHARVRKKTSGTAERPRLCVFRSLKNIYAQIIDDTTGTSGYMNILLVVGDYPELGEWETGAFGTEDPG